MKTINKAAAVILAMLILLAGCAGSENWAFSYGGYEVTNGLYINYLGIAMGDLESRHAEEAGEGEEGFEIPEIKQLLKDTYDGKTGSDWVKEEAAQLSAEYLVVNDMFDALGLSFSELDQATLNNEVEYFWSMYSESYEKAGIAYSTMYDYRENDLKRSLLFQAIYGEGGEKEVTEDELRSMFGDSYGKAEVMVMYKAYMEDEDGRSIEEQNDELREKAGSFVERLSGGEDMGNLIYEYWVEQTNDAEELASLEKPTEDQYVTIVNRDAADDDNLLANTILNNRAGVSQMAEDENYFYVVRVLDILENPDDFTAYRDLVLQDLAFEEFEDDIKDRAKALNMDVNTSSIERYTPEKIKLS